MSVVKLTGLHVFVSHHYLAYQTSHLSEGTTLSCVHLVIPDRNSTPKTYVYIKGPCVLSLQYNTIGTEASVAHLHR